MRPQLNEVALIAGTLSVTAIVSAITGYAAYRLGWMNRAPTIRVAMLGGYVLACLLTILNVWVTARLMFTSPHDLLLGTVLLIFAGAIAIALGYILSAAFLERIQSSDWAARDVASGNLEARVIVEGRDEISDLAKTFNEMASRLKSAADKQEEVENLRRELIAWVGHDLQTPLTSISAIIEALSDGIVEDEATQKRYFGTAKKNIAALSRLIDDLSQLAQIDVGGLKLEREPVSLSDLVSDTLESFSEIAARQRIGLSGEVDWDIRLLTLDAPRMGRVLNNLIENAIRHTPPEGSIRVFGRRSGNAITLEISDTGLGIPAADLPFIFDRFYRSEKSRSRITGGSGLGLAISKGIVEAHGGTISVDSRPGETRFVVTLPDLG
jgi:signal transduction histidine kinase